MALREPQPEPSMEEILASIRRIISEEGAPDAAQGEPVSAASAVAADDAVDHELLVFDEAPPRAQPAQPEPALRATAAPEDDIEFKMAPSEAPPEMLVSDPAASAAAGAFTRLAGSLRVSDVQGQTLEGVVRELLRPMLREWLDTHLPKIVEAKVEAELDRISRLAR